MAEEAKPSRAAEEEAAREREPERPNRRGYLARFLTLKWLLILLAVSLAGHAIGFAYSRLNAKGPGSESSPEVSLGVFRFTADPAEGGQIATAEFSLHIALLSQVEEAARHELQAKRLRVQEAVEQLVRRAHSGDFDDPLLAGMKQQLQERINETLGIRVIADVIITDLKLERNPNEPGMITNTASTPPWTDKPPG